MGFMPTDEQLQAQSEKIAENLHRIRNQIAESCTKSGRLPEEVTLVAVTKTVGREDINALLEQGQADLGESKVQDLGQKIKEMQESFTPKLEPPGSPVPSPVQPRWHMIGHLQRNKVKPVLKAVEMIHSVDSLRLAEEINTTAARIGLNHRVKILLQVNTSKEKQKYGLAVGAVNALAEQVMTLPNLEICGLMTMAPFTEDMDKCRFCFMRLREVFEELRGEKIVGPAFRHLSMGMTQDYPVAIEAGATLIRIGTALFEN